MGRLALLLGLAIANSAFSQSEAQKSPEKPTPRSAATGASAVPVEDPAEARRLFRELDANGDGYLTADELRSVRAQQANWAAVDRNRDGRISADEFTAIRK